MRRFVLPLAAVAALLAGHPASAGSAPLVTDPAGDERLPLAAYDILSLDLEVAVNKDTHRSELVATARMSAPPTSPGEALSVHASVIDCNGEDGEITFDLFNDLVHPARAAYATALGDPAVWTTGCGSAVDTDMPSTVVVKGATVTWTVPMTALRRHVGRGSRLLGTSITSSVNEPVTGELGTSGTSGTGDPYVDTADAVKSFHFP